MRKKCFLFLFLLVGFQLNGQVRQFDQLELLYSQKHYKLVLYKANRLLDKPDYDYSLLPEFYKSLSLFQLVQNDRWFQRNQGALNDAVTLFEGIKKSAEGMKVFNAHIYEVSALKADLYQWGEDLERMGKSKESSKLRDILEQLFDRVPNIEEQDSPLTRPFKNEITGTRGEIIAFAQKWIGTPYLWAGVTPKGFDCSGFTSYVMNEFAISLPRRAADQYEKSEKIKEKNRKPGDLIFFSNGGGVSHVGITISTADQNVIMIHASSSQGIVITDVTTSSYWQKKITGYGRYYKD